MSTNKDVILVTAEVINQYPRLALKSPDTRGVITVPFLPSSVNLMPDITEMVLGLDFVAGAERSTWVDVERERQGMEGAGAALRITCKSATEMGLWP